uniref:Uncharacterized protein n=1 Tax=Anguilla anguilla TaxID=7936 RepID=A0A0E9RKF8_ANGAN
MNKWLLNYAHLFLYFLTKIVLLFLWK